jgi:hypothetical protein
MSIKTVRSCVLERNKKNITAQIKEAASTEKE